MAKITLVMVRINDDASIRETLAATDDITDKVILLNAAAVPPSDVPEGVMVISSPFRDLSTLWNAALPQVTGDWILALDPGHTLSPSAVEALRSAVTEDDFDCGMLPEMTGDNPEAVWQPRLLRRTDDLQWEGVVDAWPTVWLSADGRRSRDIQAPIRRPAQPGVLLHSRYTGDRYRALAARRVQEAPKDLDAWTALALSQMNRKENDAATETLAQAWERLAAHADRTTAVTLVTLRTWAQLQRNQQTEAAQTLATAAGWGMMHPNLLLLQGIAVENLAVRAAEAQQSQLYEQALQALELAPTFAGRRFTAPVIDGATTWLADTRIGATQQALGRQALAAAAFERALSVHENLGEARLGLAEALLERDPARSLALVTPIVHASGVDGWLLKAAAHEVRNEDREMAQALVTGMRSIKEGFQARHRRVLMDELVSLLGLLQGSPRTGRGAMGALGGLMTGYPPPASATFPAPIGSANARRLAKVIAYLESRGETRLLDALRAPPVERLFPGIGELLNVT